jgi:hypothetical protein
MGGGPPVWAPDSRRFALISRVASAPPIESGENSRPFEPRAKAPTSRQRAASGMSAVITTSSGRISAAIQSSAASGPSSTTTISTPRSAGT